MFLFLILVNAAGFQDKILNMGDIVTNPAVNKREPIKRIHMKWIDDMTAAESIHLKENLISNPNPVQPFQYHERHGYHLPPEKSELQTLLDGTITYTEQHQMKMNTMKTKVILFNKATKYDFQPKLTILNNQTQLEVVEEIRLLGVTVRSDLSWKSNTSMMCKKAFARLWMIRRLKPLGATDGELLDVYDKQIRCVVEYASPVWTAGLTKADESHIERVQKAAFAIILGKRYTTYSAVLQLLDRKTLKERRFELNLKFAKKCLKSEKYKHWFKPSVMSEQALKTRSVMKGKLLPVQARTKAFDKSPIAYLTNLINEEK